MCSGISYIECLVFDLYILMSSPRDFVGPFLSKNGLVGIECILSQEWFKPSTVREYSEHSFQRMDSIVSSAFFFECIQTFDW